MDFVTVAIVAIFTLGVLVLIHELGHFLVARFFKVKVLEFGFGLPPRIWGKKVRETIYSINWLPFGGFVHLLGEDESNAEVLKDKHSFASQPLGVRIAIVVAGVVMNLLLAIVLYTVVLASQNWRTELPLLSNYHFQGVVQTNQDVVIVSDVLANTPASQAGLQRGDRITSLNTQPLGDTQQLIVAAKSANGAPIYLTVTDQTGQTRQVTIIPRSNPPEGEGPLGVSLGGFQVAVLEYQTPIQRIFSGPIHSYNLTLYSIDVFSKLIGTSVEKRDATAVSQGVSGPVGILQIISQIVEQGRIHVYLDFVAALSLNLAIVNILPFPGLDGGRLAFFLVELITRKKPHPTVEKYIHTAGLAILLTLIFLVTASDLRKIF